MKDTLSKVSDLVRISLHDLKKSFSLLKLVSLIDAMNRQSEDSEDQSIVIDIPVFGKLKITDDFDFIFIPDIDFKKDVYQVKQNPELFLKKELKKLLKLQTFSPKSVAESETWKRLKNTFPLV